MRNLQLTGGVRCKTTRYAGFRGVDFSTDPLMINASRSPWAPNMISDAGGMPRKRYGYRTFYDLSGGKVNGLFRCVIDGQEFLLAHVGNTIKKLKGKIMDEGEADRENVYCAFTLGGKATDFNNDELLGVEEADGMVTARFKLGLSGLYAWFKQTSVEAQITHQDQTVTGEAKLGEAGTEITIPTSTDKILMTFEKAEFERTKGYRYIVSMYMPREWYYGKSGRAPAEISGSDAIADVAVNVYDGPSTSVFAGGQLFIYTGTQFLSFDGVLHEGSEYACREVKGRVPEIVIGRAPNGGGTFYEAINLLCSSWRESFLSDGESKEYQLSYTELDAVEKVEQLSEDGSWDVVDPSKYSIDLEAGTVTFSTAPAESPVTGHDNIRITASKERPENRAKILNCRTATLYDGTTIFCCGSERGVDFRSGYKDFTYFPDTGYDEVGTNESDIMGYLRIGKYLAVVKEDNAQDSTIWIRWEEVIEGSVVDSTGSMIETDELTYKREPCISGIGAVARKGFGVLDGDPLFLTKRGVFAVASDSITAEKITQNRSWYVDPKLTAEPQLQNACACVWKGYYVLALNGRVYLLDANQSKSYKEKAGAYVYECLHWENVPAITMLSFDEQLWFGTDDGRICRFLTAEDGIFAYADDGEPIKASWSTKLDDDGDFGAIKGMTLAGSCALFRGGEKATTTISVVNESGDVVSSGRIELGRKEVPQAVPIKVKLTRYRAMRLVAENDRLYEGLGVYGFTKRWFYRGYR